jgi:hypothetical protein
MKADILQILHEEAMTSNHSRADERVVNSDEFDTVANQIVNLFKNKKYTEEDMLKAFERGALYGSTKNGNTHYFEDLINSLNKQD